MSYDHATYLDEMRKEVRAHIDALNANLDDERNRAILNHEAHLDAIERRRADHAYLHTKADALEAAIAAMRAMTADPKPHAQG